MLACREFVVDGTMRTAAAPYFDASAGQLCEGALFVAIEMSQSEFPEVKMPYGNVLLHAALDLAALVVGVDFSSRQAMGA